MTGKTITLALALLVGATAIAAAQSQRNYGAERTVQLRLLRLVLYRHGRIQLPWHP